MAAHSTGSAVGHCILDHHTHGHSSVGAHVADMEVVHSQEPEIAHNCYSSLVQEGSLVAGYRMVESPACSSQNHHPDMKGGAEGPAFGPSPCRLSGVLAVGNHRRVGYSSEVEPYLLVGIHSQAGFESVAPTEKPRHDPEGGNLANHTHQIDLCSLRNSAQESLLETRKETK